MCGLWFSLGFPPDPAAIDLVAHRGPDGRGWQVFESSAGPVALGHRRLSIIDLSEAASQPMSDAAGRYWVIFNGEIYNYLELRDELKASGHVFRTQSDTEVLIAAYAEWGEAALDRLVGMFAFVLWDDKAQTVFAARDRFAIKPLYFYANGRGIAFASEIKQFSVLNGFAARLNPARAYDFLSSGIMDHTAETMFSEVGQLRGGECVRLDLQRWRPGELLPVRRWYEIVEPGTLDGLDEAEASRRFAALLAELVRLHLRSDVPVGSCLSGGLDSSSIVCLMARELDALGQDARVHNISACYAEKSVDERPFMEAVVEHAGCVPHWCYPRVEDAFALAEKITWHQDEPYGSTSIFAQWCVFAEARQAGLKVMLDGQGADEQLAGYHGGFSYYFTNLVQQRRYAMLLRAMLERRAWHGLKMRDQMNTLAPLIPARLARLLRRGHQTLVQHDWMNGEGLRPHLARSAFETAREQIGRPPVAGIGDLCVVMTQASNLAMLLHWEDRNSMAHGIEARVPFLDHRLVEFNLGLGDRHKIVGGDTKRVLRRAMSGILPNVVRDRRDKLGFATPEEVWFRGPLREAVLGGVEDTLARFPGLLNPSGVRAHVGDMLAGRRPVDFSLWRIVNLGIWGRVFAASA